MRTKAEEAKKEKSPKNEYQPMIDDDSSATDRKKAIASLMSKINSDAKYTVIAPADEVVNPYFLRRPSGIMQLDIDTGGGLPAGGVSMLTGPDNSGKSFLLYKYCAQHQRLYGSQAAIALAPVEGAPDYFFMRKCGFMIAIPDMMIEERNKQRKLQGRPPYTKEERAELKRQTGTVAILGAQNGEDLLDAVHETVRRNVFGIIGIDSITAIQPQEIAKQDTLHDGGRRASHATLATNFFQRLYPFLIGMWGRNDTTIICTQQVRANAAKANALPHIQKYLRDWAPAGSYAARHGKMIDLLVWEGAKIRSGKTSDAGEIIGKYMTWETEKGKAGTHDNIRGDTAFYYETLTNDLDDVVTTGIRYRAIVEDNGYLSLVRAQTGEIFDGWSKLAGPQRFVDKMRESLEAEIFVRQEILLHAELECAYR